MENLRESIRKKIEVERNKIAKLKLEIKTFKERKEEEILSAEKKITSYEKSLLTITA